MLLNTSPGRNSPQIPSRTAGFLNGNRGRSPRFTTPTLGRAGPGSHHNEPNESPSRLMDVDTSYGQERSKQSEEARVFAASDTLTIRLAASLPREVQQVLNTSDPLKDAFTGAVDIVHNATSYGIVLSTQACFVWKIDLQNPFHPPTCYIFPVPPPDLSSSHPAALHALLVPFGTSREPGLILVSSTGELRLWDSIGIGLAGAERFSSTKVDLAENEVISGLDRIEAALFVLRTTLKLYRLSLTSRPGTGKHIIVATRFSDPDGRSSSWLNPFRILPRKSDTWDVGNIISVRQSSCYQSTRKGRETDGRNAEERLIWVLTDKHLMQWCINLAGGEQCIQSFEVKHIVGDALCQGLDTNKHMLDVELLDVTVDCFENPVLLVSHTPLMSSSREKAPASDPLRSYSIVRLHQPSTSDTLAIKGVAQNLPYELTSDPRHGHATIPRFVSLEASQTEEPLGLFFSQFSDGFAFTSLDPSYQEQIYLKKPEDAILGYNVLLGAYHDVLILTKSMVIIVRSNPVNIAKLRNDVDGGKITVLKSTIRQAMKYGIKPENPLKFHLPSNADGENLATAAEEMSHAFLVSHPDVVTSSLSLGSQLAGRESSLEALITFIGDNGILDKLPMTTREKLLINAEKLAAARSVWQCHNEQVLRHGSANLLHSVMEVYMAQKNQAEGDLLRAFFLLETPHIDKLIPVITMIVHSERSDRLAESSQLLLQACALVDTLFASVFAYRSRCYSRYHLSDLMFQQWTSEPDLLSSSRQLFETACDYMETSESSVEEEFRLLLQRLASHLFRIFNDRLQYLNLRSQENNSAERERNRLEEEFRSLRPFVFNQLVQLGCLDFCFQLAEQYRDFHALSDLIYRTSAGSVTARIRSYIDQFKDDFTSQLYRWYIEQGKLQLLFNQDVEDFQYLDDFFENNPTPRLSWIHALGKKNYREAASALLNAAKDDMDRETKHLMLSVGKLATMANGPAATPQNKLLSFDTALDFIAIHNSLLQQFTDQEYSAELALDTRVKRLTAEKCHVPSDRAALQAQFQKVLQRLLQGKALSEEDAVDILSMKDNTQHPSNFVDALNIIVQSSYMSEERKKLCLRNVWRRIYLHDDWRNIRLAANKTDHELTAALRRTQVYQILISPNAPTASKVLPSEAVVAPTSEELVARHPGLAPSQIQELIRDYKRECQLLSQGGPSDSEFTHVQQLAHDDTLRRI